MGKKGIAGPNKDLQQDLFFPQEEMNLDKVNSPFKRNSQIDGDDNLGRQKIKFLSSEDEEQSQIYGQEKQYQDKNHVITNTTSKQSPKQALRWCANYQKADPFSDHFKSGWHVDPILVIGILVVLLHSSNSQSQDVEIINVGTAFRVSKTRVMTAAHVVYSGVKEQHLKEIYFIPWCRLRKRKFYILFDDFLAFVLKNGQKMRIFFMPPLYYPPGKGQELTSGQFCCNEKDYAVVQFEKHTDFVREYQGFKWLLIQKQNQSYFNVVFFGNSCIKNKKERKYEFELHQFIGRAYCSKGALYYPFQTQGGCSGGPIFARYNQCQKILSFHLKSINKRVNQQQVLIIGKAGLLLNNSMRQIIRHTWTFNPTERLETEIWLKNIEKRYQNQSPTNVLVRFTIKNMVSSGDELCQLIKGLSQSFLKQIVSLNLIGNGITSTGCQSLADACLVNLRCLDLSHNPIKAEGVKLLSSSSFLFNLQRLNLVDCEIGDDFNAKEPMLKFSNLKRLNLSKNRLASCASQSLIRSQLTKLEQINLSFNRISDKCCGIISFSKWPALSVFIIAHNQIQDKGCEFLSKSNWPNIQAIFADDCNFSEYGRYLLDQKIAKIVTRKNMKNQMNLKML